MGQVLTLVRSRFGPLLAIGNIVFIGYILVINRDYLKMPSAEKKKKDGDEDNIFDEENEGGDGAEKSAKKKESTTTSRKLRQRVSFMHEC